MPYSSVPEVQTQYEGKTNNLWKVLMMNQDIYLIVYRKYAAYVSPSSVQVRASLVTEGSKRVKRLI